MKCAKHPEAETNLTCGKCGVAICPRCMIQTPVGVRCRKCAGLKRLPTYEITRAQYLKAIAVALGLAIGVGITWGLLRDLFVFPFLGFQFGVLWGIPAGYAIGELLSLSMNRKRGKALIYIGAAAVVLSYIISALEFSTVAFTFNLWDLLALALGIYIAVSRLR